MLQYNYRPFHLHTQLNKLDAEIIDLLVDLSINSDYETVRDEARTNLFYILAQYPYSVSTIVPKLVQVLEQAILERDDGGLEKEQLEGCLLLLLGNNRKGCLLITQNWEILAKIWPALFRCKYFEQETIRKLLDHIYNHTNQSFESFNNQSSLSDSAMESAIKISPISKSNSGILTLKEKSDKEKRIIADLINDLIQIAKDPQIMWKNQEISLFSLIYLLNSCKMYPDLLSVELVKLFTNSLIHENVNIRKVI